MANVNGFKVVIDNVVPQIEVLQKAIELDPANVILYQRAIDFCETNISVSETIIKAIKLVEKDSKKTAEDSKKTEEKPKTSTKKKEPKPVPVVEAEKVEEETDIFDMFD
jgi:hypothetical protein